MKALFFILILVIGAHGALSILSPSPANNSVQATNTTTFNWSSNGLACSASTLMVNKTGTILPIVNQTYLTCNQSLTMNLANGSYVWAVQTVAIPSENSGLYYFNISPTVLATLIYPQSLSVFGPNQCNLLATVSASDDINESVSRSTVFRLYFYNNTDYVSVQNITGPYSGSVNFTSFANSGFYAINATSTAGSASNNTATVIFQVIGTSYCTGGSNATAPMVGLPLFLLGAALVILSLGDKDGTD